MRNVATTRLMKVTHYWRKKHVSDKIHIPRAHEIKDDALDRSELIVDEYEVEESERNIYQQSLKVCEKKLCHYNFHKHTFICASGVKVGGFKESEYK